MVENRSRKLETQKEYNKNHREKISEYRKKTSPISAPVISSTPAIIIMKLNTTMFCLVTISDPPVYNYMLIFSTTLHRDLSPKPLPTQSTWLSL